ncbi:phosphoglycolate phosphatase [Ramlibacter tataouinensis]|nr:phosphoglycolate phosphatase [Ramlibacter tataouinensis]
MPIASAQPLHAAIIDLDGTLIDTLGDFGAALAGMLDELSLPAIGADAVARLVGKGSEHLIRSVLAQVEGDPALYPAAWEAYQRHYLAINGRHSTVFPGAPQALRSLRGRGLKLACVTNKPQAFTDPLLRAKGLDRCFDAVFGGDAFARKKPDPLPLLMAARALGAQPARTLVVGDSSNDAQAGRAAGCPVLLVTFGYNHGEPVQAVDADAYLNSWSELDSTLGRLFPARLP